MISLTGNRRRTLRWCVFLFAIVTGLSAALTSTGAFNSPLRRALEIVGKRTLGEDFQIRKLEGNPLFKPRLGGISWSTTEGGRVLVGEAQIQYRPRWLLLGRVHIDSLRIVSPQIDIASGPVTRKSQPWMPSTNIDALVVEHGVVAVDGMERARDVALSLGIEHREAGSRVTLRGMRSVVFDPPIHITNLEGILLRSPEQLILDNVQLASVKSTCRIDGSLLLRDPPFLDFSTRSDSRAAESPLTYLGIDLPPTDGWVRGTFQGSLDDLRIEFQWVAGGAAGEGLARGNLWHSPRTLSVDLTGKEVQLGGLLGVTIGGELSSRLDLQEVDGRVDASATAVLSEASFLNGRLDTISAKLNYSGKDIEGSVSVIRGDGGADLSVLFDPDQKAGKLTGRISNLDIETFGGPLSSLSGTVAVHIGPDETSVSTWLTEVGVAGLDVGSLLANASFTTAGGRLNSFVWTDDAFRVTAEGSLTPTTDDTVGGLNLKIAGELFPPAWTPATSVPASVSLSGRLYEARGPMGARSHTVDLKLHPSATFLGMDTLDVGMVLEGRQVRIEALRASGKAASYEAEGGFVIGRSWDVALSGHIRSLEGFPAPEWVSLQGQAALRASAFGSWLQPDLEVTAATDTLSFMDAPLIRPHLRLHRTERSGLSLRAHALEWAGRELQGLYADFVESEGEISFLIGNAGTSEDRIQLWGDATSESDQTRIGIDSLLIRTAEVTVSNQGSSSLTWSGKEGLRVHRMAFGGAGGSLLAKSRPDRMGTLDVTVDRVDLRPWAFVLGVGETLSGLVSAKASFVRGAGLEAEIDAEALRWGDLTADSLTAEIAIGQVGNLDVSVWQGDGRIDVKGAVPVDEWGIVTRGPLDIELSGQAVDVARIEDWVPWVSDVSGQADVSLTLTGRSDSASAMGTISVRDGRATVDAVAQTVSDLSASLRLSPGRVTVHRASGKGGDGLLEATGVVQLAPIDLVSGDHITSVSQFDLALNGASFNAVNLPEFGARVDAQVQIAGTVDTPAVSGIVNFREAEIRLLSLLEAPPDPESVWRTVPFFRNLHSTLQLVAQNQVWVRDENLNVELNGDVDLLRNEEGVRLFGSLSSLRGAYRFQNRDFRIERGQIDFTGAGTIDPIVSIVGATRLPILQNSETSAERDDVTIRVIVGGTITQPEITVESDPPVGDEATILSYILLGRPPDDFLSGQQGVFGEQSAGLVMGLAANQLKERIGQELNLDVVQLEMATGARVSRVRVGKYISDRIFVSYDDPIGTDAREFTVEYELLPDLTLESRVGFDDEGDQKSKLFMTWRKDW
ncbi:MAG: hypothetical protein CME26_12535 [Gemmatimonadetes bacterium]|nr:hypothetical protein [Gemmatimonadota bacterium]